MKQTVARPLLQRKLLAEAIRSRQPDVKMQAALDKHAHQVAQIASGAAAAPVVVSSVTPAAATSDSEVRRGVAVLGPTELLARDMFGSFVPSPEELAEIALQASQVAPRREIKEDRPEKSEVTAAKVEIAHIDLFKRVRGKKGVEGISLKVNWQCKSDILYLTECRTKAAKKKADHSTRMLRLSATFGDIAGYTIERDVGGCWLTLSLVSLPQLSASRYDMVAPKKGGKKKMMINYGAIDLSTAVAAARTSLADVDEKQLRQVSIRFDNEKSGVLRGALHPKVILLFKHLPQYLLAYDSVFS